MAIVWTKHAIERNKERQVTISWVEKTINNPDRGFNENQGKTKYIKKFGNQTVSVVCAKGSNGEYLILSAWVNPPNPGTEDFKNKEFQKQMKKVGNVKKFWLTILRQIGI